MHVGPITAVREIRHAHLFCGIGGGARGFNRAAPRVGNSLAKFVCVGGIDVDAGAIKNFEHITGASGTVMDLFDRQQYEAFHGVEPPKDFVEATPADIRKAFGPSVDVMFLSAPCKGFSGLLSAKKAGTDKYQALNELTLRGIWLTLEAYKDNPIGVILFENVPRILTRGKLLIDQITALLRSYGYSVNLDTHDCGVIGNLAQSRKRALLLARHIEKIPPFIYRPREHKLRGTGEVIGKLPLPGDPIAGSMHRVPALQWKTWVRLALVPAGKDWRALNDLEVVDGNLRDFGIVPEVPLRENALGVNSWSDTAPVITTHRAPGQGRFSVADPRVSAEWNADVLGVRDWEENTGTVAGRNTPSNGAYSVADPRVDGHPRSVQLGVRSWDKPAACVKADVSVGGGPYAVSDPRITGKPRFNNVFRIVPFEEAAPAVAGPGGPAGGVAVADPRHHGHEQTANKYKVTPFNSASRTVLGNSSTGDGAYAVADPRPNWGRDHTIIKSGDKQRDNWKGTEHYGVKGWDDTADPITASGRYDNGRHSVADPREAVLDCDPILMPEPKDRLVCRIIATDGTWHRPFTTLDLAALQSLFEPEEVFYQKETEQGMVWRCHQDFDLEATSDVTKREWIGNIVPGAAATGIADTIGETILLAEQGEAFFLSMREIWAKPGAIALAVDNDQPAFHMDNEED